MKPVKNCQLRSSSGKYLFTANVLEDPGQRTRELYLIVELCYSYTRLEVNLFASACY